MNKTFRIAVVSLILAFLCGFASHRGAYDYYRLKTGNFLYDNEVREIKSTVKLFSDTVAGFYATGGSVSGLNMFPAEKMVKRRIFQDINTWKDSGKLFVLDRDKLAIKEVKFISPDRAIAVSDENWFSVLQDSQTRRQISGKKADFITVRYFLKKMWGKWIVGDYEVYPQGEILPPLTVERLAAW